MPYLSLELTDSTRKNAIKKMQLIRAIQKKREEFEQVVIKVEMLRINLEIIQKEYMVKVGELLVKDNHLDLEIIRTKNILLLMKNGFSYKEALKKLANTYYSKQIELEKEQKQINWEKSRQGLREEMADNPKHDIKKLWKKLISTFHPDLVQDPIEKKKRNKIMQQINRAYHDGDYDQMVRISQQHTSYKEKSIDNLEEMLLSIINDISLQKKKYKSLLQSEWYGWMKKIAKAKSKSESIFNETEKTLLADIALKTDHLCELERQIREIR